jgi:transposase-like protein
MGEKNTTPVAGSRIAWQHLEGWIRSEVEAFVQRLLEDEVTEVLGRGKSVRREAVDAPMGYRNGYGKPRQLTLGCGTITVRRPRVREAEERFRSRVLPLFVRKSPGVDRVLPELYLHGLACGDFDLALRGLLGGEAPLSASTIARLKAKWQADLAAWNARPLADLDVVYVWVDGVYVKAGLEKEKAALLVVLAALRDGQKVVVAVTPGHRESTASWSAVLRDLRHRGLRPARVLVGDGHLGIWAALRNVYPEVDEQRCWNHKILNVLEQLPTRQHAVAKPLLTRIPYATSQAEAEAWRDQFTTWCRQRGYTEAATTLERDWARMVTFYHYPREHWQHIRTTNPVESPFATARLRTDAAKRFKRVENATAILWRMLLVAESRFRRLKHPDLLDAVYRGVKYADGVPARTKAAA